jgi:hypothetical protein
VARRPHECGEEVRSARFRLEFGRARDGRGSASARFRELSWTVPRDGALTITEGLARATERAEPADELPFKPQLVVAIDVKLTFEACRPERQRGGDCLEGLGVSEMRSMALIQVALPRLPPARPHRLRHCRS